MEYPNFDVRVCTARALRGTTACDGVRFSMVGISRVGIVAPVPQSSALEPFRRELSSIFGIGTVVVVELSSLENRPWWGVIHTRSV